MLKIGEFSKLAQLSVKTLRYYDKRGLLNPAWVDRFTGYRYYTPEQLPRLNRILALKELGFSLEQIGDLLEEDVPASELYGMLRMKRAELARRLEAEQARLARVEARLRQIDREGERSAYEIVLKSVPRRRILGLREIVPTYSAIHGQFQRLCAYLQAQHVASDVTRPPLAIYYDKDYRERDVDVEVAVVVDRAIPAPAGMVNRTLPALAQVASTVHHGALRDLPGAYQALLSWIERNRYQVSGPIGEHYLRSPESADDGSDVVVEVQFPIEEKPASFYVTEFGKERAAIQPMIITKPAFTVVGLTYHGKNENDEIKALWARANARATSLVAAADGVGAAYGVCGVMRSDGSFDYLAGLEVKAIDELPEGMERWTVPEQTYAVFPCTLSTIHAAYRYAFEAWMPQSGYRRADGPDFEYYDETFDVEDVENSQLYVYIPITK
jgi:predicted transcriptional regulator YdeE